MTFPKHLCRVGRFLYESEATPSPQDYRRHVQPWLSAVYQTEHLALLTGSGLTAAVANAVGAPVAGMEVAALGTDYDKQLSAHASCIAEELGRGRANIEDQIRATNQLISGLRIIDEPEAQSLARSLDVFLKGFVKTVLETEHAIRCEVEKGSAAGLAGRALITSLLLSFASRPASRERLNIFTTNYDRLIEYGCDAAGLRIVDRFVGRLTPIFRASRIDVDFHYTPPGVRGEPRYLDGVVRLTKLHGSLDWKSHHGMIRHYGIPFGSAADHPDLPSDSDEMIIYPNAAKDVETSEYPYAELFRDFSAALCRPNSALVTYGYGFGDDHINRVIGDMLTIPSTHLVIISYDGATGRIQRFCDNVGRVPQISLLIGSHFGDLDTLIHHYLPKSTMSEIAERARHVPYLDDGGSSDEEGSTLHLNA